MGDLKSTQRIFEKVPGMEPDVAPIDEMSITLIEYCLKEEPSRLFQQSSACLAIFRELTSIQQNFILRLLFVEQAVPQAVVASWVKSKETFQKSSEVLTNLQIWKSVPSHTGLPGYLLNETFRDSFKYAFMGGGKSRGIFHPLSDDKHKQSVENLDDYAITKRWDSILNFMAGVRNSDNRDAVGDTSRNVLEYSKLIVPSRDSEGPEITALGFQFLLMDISSQVWFFVRKYLETVPKDCYFERLAFIFELNFLTLGKSYSSETMSSNMLQFIQELRELGLVYQRKRKDGRFYPTRLIVQLFESVRNNMATVDLSQSQKSTGSKRRGFIIVETNYRLYAYTNSPLQIALLALFAELEYRFAYFVTGTVTRESVRMALKNGITAKQITNYLTMHAHQQMVKADRQTVLPTTVIDQIFLWEQERNRLAFRDGVLYSQFNSFAEYEVLYKYANDMGIILYENSSKRLLVVTQSGHELIRVFWKQQKDRSSQKK